MRVIFECDFLGCYKPTPHKRNLVLEIRLVSKGMGKFLPQGIFSFSCCFCFSVTLWSFIVPWDWLWAFPVQLRWKAKKAPFWGAQAISEIPLQKSSDSNLVSDPWAKGQSQVDNFYGAWCRSCRCPYTIHWSPIMMLHVCLLYSFMKYVVGNTK
jgi:hypothetical protein